MLPISEAQNKLDEQGNAKDETLVPKLDFVLRQVQYFHLLF